MDTPPPALVAALLALACNSPTSAPMPPAAPPRDDFPGLFAREGERIVDAPPGDQAVARGYPEWPAKGRFHEGLRLTILTARTHVAVGEEVRVIHVVEVAAGREAYPMGPKPVHGEFVDGAVTGTAPPTPEYPWVGDYDGRVQTGPAIDYNFEVTTHRFDRAGTHHIAWRLGGAVSNDLTIEATR